MQETQNKINNPNQLEQLGYSELAGKLNLEQLMLIDKLNQDYNRAFDTTAKEVAVSEILGQDGVKDKEKAKGNLEDIIDNGGLDELLEQMLTTDQQESVAERAEMAAEGAVDERAKELFEQIEGVEFDDENPAHENLMAEINRAVKTDREAFVGDSDKKHPYVSNGVLGKLYAALSSEESEPAKRVEDSNDDTQEIPVVDKEADEDDSKKDNDDKVHDLKEGIGKDANAFEIMKRLGDLEEEAGASSEFDKDFDKLGPPMGVSDLKNFLDAEQAREDAETEEDEVDPEVKKRQETFDLLDELAEVNPELSERIEEMLHEQNLEIYAVNAREAELRKQIRKQEKSDARKAKLKEWRENRQAKKQEKRENRQAKRQEKRENQTRIIDKTVLNSLRNMRSRFEEAKSSTSNEREEYVAKRKRLGRVFGAVALTATLIEGFTPRKTEQQATETES